jgi:hypothetical protein
LVKALKSFRVYIFHSRIISYVPSASVKEILIHPDIDGKRSKWIAKILEFDLEMKPTKLVKGKGLARLLAESNCKALGVNFMNADFVYQQTDIASNNSQISPKLTECNWYKDLIHFLQTLQPPPGLDKTKVRYLKLKAIRYCIVDHVLYWKDPVGVLLRCLDPDEAKKTMSDFHDSLCGGHHFWRTTTYKILRVGYFWPSLFTDVCAKIRACDKCQKFSGKQQLKSLPLKPIMASGPFQQWGLDFIGEIHPASSGQHRWILTATDYFTKWIESIPTRNATHKVVIGFLEDLLSRFGCPNKIMTDNVAAFKVEPLVKFCEKFGIQLIHSTPYYPQGNGLAESSNKILVNIIKKLLEDNKKSWDSKMKFSLWADRVTTKRSIGTTPFQLVYGTKVVFPSQLALPVENFLQDQQGEPDDMVRRMHHLVEVQQTREQLLDKAQSHQQKIKQDFDKKVNKEYFQLGDLVLKWDAQRQDKGKHGKFEALWIGPFNISEVFQNNTYKLQNLEDSEISGGPVNGHFLKKYFS